MGNENNSNANNNTSSDLKGSSANEPTTSTNDSHFNQPTTTSANNSSSGIKPAVASTSTSSSVVAAKNSEDNITTIIPEEVLVKVLTYLDVKSISSLFETSKAFNNLLKDHLHYALSEEGKKTEEKRQKYKGKIEALDQQIIPLRAQLAVLEVERKESAEALTILEKTNLPYRLRIYIKAYNKFHKETLPNFEGFIATIKEYPKDDRKEEAIQLIGDFRNPLNYKAPCFSYIPISMFVISFMIMAVFGMSLSYSKNTDELIASASLMFLSIVIVFFSLVFFLSCRSNRYLTHDYTNPELGNRFEVLTSRSKRYRPRNNEPLENPDDVTEYLTKLKDRLPDNPRTVYRKSQALLDKIKTLKDPNKEFRFSSETVESAHAELMIYENEIKELMYSHFEHPQSDSVAINIEEDFNGTDKNNSFKMFRIPSEHNKDDEDNKKKGKEKVINEEEETPLLRKDTKNKR